MLILVFHLGPHRYAIDALNILEVLPMVELEPVARAPAFITGMFRYRGELIPVLDLRQLIHDQPSNSNMTTRILLIRYPLANGHDRILGLLGEKITETLKIPRETFEPTGIHVAETPYLNRVANDAQGMIHFMELQQLLPDTVCDLLFSEAVD